MQSWLIPSAFLAALVVAALATPIVARFAILVGAVDRPNERKVSRRESMPLLGGIAVALGFFVGLGVALILLPEQLAMNKHLEAMVIGGILVLAIGAVDDRWGLSALTKLSVQIVAAGVAISAGFQIDHLTDPISLTTWHFPTPLVWLVTGAWIIVVTNAINLIDGIDGLSTGVSAIIACTLTVIAWQGGHVPGVLMGTVLVGSLLGFLPWNFPPARIFVGDTGAYFIGFSLSLLALEGYQRVTLITFIVPLLALAVPLLDVLLSVVRRVRRGDNFMAADRHHIHHKMLSEYSGSHRQAALSLYFLTACFCTIAVSFTRLRGFAAIVFLVVIALLTLRILWNLGFFDLADGEVAAEGPTTGESSTGARSQAATDGAGVPHAGRAVAHRGAHGEGEA
ncbi:MAG: MraY family glycosyltransferase [Myxococcota bacterium]|nr:MraY family glycosyltransferase [Myxococcota bacterium]